MKTLRRIEIDLLNVKTTYLLKKTKRMQKIAFCFNNAMINFDLQDKYNLGFFVIHGFIQWSLLKNSLSSAHIHCLFAFT